MTDHRRKLARALRRHLSRLFGARANCTAGLAAVEFGIMAPVLVLALICTVDLGLGVYRKMQVQNAAQAGAEYALTHGFLPSMMKTAATSATSYAAIQATPDPVQFCGCPSATGITSTSCSSTCDGGALAGTYVTMSAQATYSPLIPYPMLPASYAFTSQSTVRIQ